MRFTQPIILLVVFLILPTGPGAAQPSMDRDNAARWYQRAFEEMRQHISDADAVTISDYVANPGQPPTLEVRRILDRATRMMSFLRRGSTRPFADYQLDYSEGMHLMLPHLSQQRHAARFLAADALLAIHDGDSTLAADRLATAYRIGGHGADDGLLVSSLVGASVFSNADKIVQYGLDRGALNKDDAATLLRDAEALPRDDPFGIVDAAAMEQTIMVNWLAERFTRDGGETLKEDFTQAFANESVAEPFESMSQDEFFDALDRYDHAMDLAVEAISDPDPAVTREKLDALEKRIESGEFGPLANLFLPSYSKINERLQETRRMVRDRAESLRELASGTVSPNELANAAVWYLRAIDALYELDPEHIAAIREAAARPTVAPTPELNAALQAAADVIATVNEGSRIRRCDFSIAPDHEQRPTVSSYAPGMRDLFRLLHADAIANLHHDAELHAGMQPATRTGGSDEAPSNDDKRSGTAVMTSRLAASFRVTAHLNDDPYLLSARVAHAGFDEAMRIVSEAVAHERLTARQRITLLDAARRISRSDPFGYVIGIMFLREDVARRFRNVMNTLPAPQQEQSHGAASQPHENPIRFDNANGDQLLYMYIVLEAVLHDGEDAAERYTEALPGLQGVIDTEALRATISEAAMIEMMLSKQQFDLLGRADVPMIADVDKHMHNARADLRRATLLIQPDEPVQRSERGDAERSPK